MSNRFEQVAGGIVFVDGAASIVYSTDQRPLSNLGRLLRIGIGFGLVLDGSISDPPILATSCGASWLPVSQNTYQILHGLEIPPARR